MSTDHDASGDRDSGGSYRELYLKAHERAGAERALVPHEDIVAAFSTAGFAPLVDDLRYRDDWLVWTPDGRDTPLYAYTPDLAGDTDRQRERVADLLAEAGLGRERFVDVIDGQKMSFDTGNARLPDDDGLGGNYGVKGGRGGDNAGRWLVDIDVDDYDDATASNAAVDRLRDETTAVASAHTTHDRPGHLYVAVDGDPRDVVHDVLGREVDNPAPSFGEIRVDNQYVLGPGSAVVCGCDSCTDPDAPDHFGHYELANDAPPVVWSPDEFREFLLADPAIRRQAEQAAAADQADASAGSSTSVGAGGTTADADGWLALARDADDYVADAIREARSPDDRSEADSGVARAVAPWLGYDRDAIADVLDDHGTGKWNSRGASYRDSVLDYALSRRTSVESYRPLPYWALVEAAVANDLVDRDELVDRDSETGEVVDGDQGGETYTALPSGTYDDALRVVRETYGVDHGRDRADSDARSAYYDADLSAFANGDADADPWTEPEVMLRACLRARDAGAVPEHAAPPTLALLPLQRDVLGQVPDRDMNDGTADLLEDLYRDLDVDELDDVLGGE